MRKKLYRIRATIWTDFDPTDTDLSDIHAMTKRNDALYAACEIDCSDETPVPADVSDFFTIGAPADDEDETLYRNSYRCPGCGAEWQDTWDSGCDDECGDCGMQDISPYESVKVDECGNVIEEASGE